MAKSLVVVIGLDHHSGKKPSADGFIQLGRMIEQAMGSGQDAGKAGDSLSKIVQPTHEEIAGGASGTSTSVAPSSARVSMADRVARAISVPHSWKDRIATPSRPGDIPVFMRGDLVMAPRTMSRSVASQARTPMESMVGDSTSVPSAGTDPFVGFDH